jgi:calcineurin-like phosphoesterase family protein
MPKRGEAFGSIEEMGDHLVDEINRVVRPKDILIHCGDFCWRAGRAGHWRQRLNVREIHVTQGNHDASSLRKHVSTMDYMLFKKFNQAHRMPDNFHMQHYPCLSWRKMQHKQFHLYGHSHGLFEDVLNNLWPGRRAMDVGIDHAFRLTGEWRPLSLDEVLFYMDHPPTPTGDVLPGVTPMDHHEPGRFICREPDPRLQHGDDPEAPGIWRK